MKLDKIRFAELVNYLGRRGVQFDTAELVEIDNLIDVSIPEATVAYPSTDDINELMRLMAQGTQKIEAIKLHRKLTGWGLKDSKDEVEKYWTNEIKRTKQEMYGKLNKYHDE